MDGAERQQFVREQRELAAREAKRAREELARRRAALPPGEEGREQPPEFARQRQHDRLVYKAHDNGESAAAPTTTADTSEGEFILDVVAGCLAEERARHKGEMDALANRIAELEKRNSADLIAATDRLAAKLDEVKRYTEAERRSRSEPLDLPPLPRERCGVN
jgi:hypothetical protein